MSDGDGEAERKDVLTIPFEEMGGICLTVQNEKHKKMKVIMILPDKKDAWDITVNHAPLPYAFLNASMGSFPGIPGSVM